MNDLANKVDCIAQSFGPRSCTPTEFNALLLSIIELASLQFCREKDAQGLSRAEINVELVDHLEAMERWRSTTLQEFTAFAEKVKAP